jgi:outer membrane biosynthesis protein TonB
LPRIISKADPIFPSQALRVRFQGTERLVVTVGTDGVPRVNQIVQSLDSTFSAVCRRSLSENRWPDAPYASPAECPEHLGFDEAAIQAVNQWRFAPAIREGSPVPAVLTFSIDFILH